MMRARVVALLITLSVLLAALPSCVEAPLQAWPEIATRRPWRAMAIQSEDGVIYAKTGSSGRFRRLGHGKPPLVAPSGKAVAFLDCELESCALVVSDLERETNQRWPIPVEFGPGCLSWDPTSKLLAAMLPSRQAEDVLNLVVFAVETGEVRSVARESNDWRLATCPQWSSDGSTVSYRTMGHLIIVEVADGTTLALASETFTQGSCASPSYRHAVLEGGRGLALQLCASEPTCGTSPSRVALVALDGTILRELTPGDMTARDPFLAPSGDAIVFSGMDCATKRSGVWLVPVGGGAPELLVLSRTPVSLALGAP